jgi:thiamine biosynthesis lipoprotein
VWSRISSCLLLLSAAAAAEERIEAFQTCMGTQFRVTVRAADIRGAQRAIAAAFQRGAELDAKLSDYIPDSELNRLCSARRMRVSEDLRRVLEYSLRVHRESGGAFDITAGSLIRRWREARRTGVLPSAARPAGHLKLSGNLASLSEHGMRLDLGGIAKGFAASEMLKVLRAAGFGNALVAASGDLAVGDGGWSIEIGATGKVETLSKCAVSTSGDESQYVEIGGVRYSHIVDPRTGIGLTGSRPVTVIAPEGMEADALATTLQVRPSLARRMSRKHPGIRVYQAEALPDARPSDPP